MRKRVFEKGKLAAAAAGLALALSIGAAGCGAGDKEAVENVSGEAGDAGEEAGADAGSEAEDADGQKVQLPEYTAVVPDSVAESAEGDFIIESDGSGRVYITGYQGAGGQVKIPAHLGGAETISIMSDAFKGNETITYIYIPETVTMIEKSSFRGCTSLEEAYIGASALSIAESTFRGCTALRRVELTGAVSTIEGGMDTGAFQDCTSLTEVVFPDTLNNRIDMNAFRGCTALETVDLSNTQLLGIGQLAFGYCENLKTVKLPATTQWVESNSFLADPALTEFIVGEGNGVLEVEDGVVYTLDDCGREPAGTALFGLEGAMGEDLVIREGTVAVAGHSLSHNQKIRTVKLPDSVKEIGSSAFSDCPSLSQADLGNGVETIEQMAFESCVKLEEINLPASLTKLEDSSFAFCGLKKVSLPDNVKYSSGSSTQKYVFAGNTDAVFTYQGQEYTYDQAGQLDAFLMK